MTEQEFKEYLKKTDGGQRHEILCTVEGVYGLIKNAEFSMTFVVSSNQGTMPLRYKAEPLVPESGLYIIREAWLPRPPKGGSCRILDLSASMIKPRAITFKSNAIQYSWKPRREDPGPQMRLLLKETKHEENTTTTTQSTSGTKTTNTSGNETSDTISVSLNLKGNFNITVNGELEGEIAPKILLENSIAEIIAKVPWIGKLGNVLKVLKSAEVAAKLRGKLSGGGALGIECNLQTGYVHSVKTLSTKSDEASFNRSHLETRQRTSKYPTGQGKIIKH